jgi:hypothetical protein
MSTDLDPRRAAIYTAPATREATLAEAIGYILSGRPFPESLRAPSYAMARPLSVSEGIGRILGDPRAAA